MQYPDDMAKIEATLTERGVSVAEFCRAAGIAETTWGRWKRGDFKPSWGAWAKTQATYHDLTSNTRGAP